MHGSMIPSRSFAARLERILGMRMSSAPLNVGRHCLRVFLSEPPGGDYFETLESVGNFEVVVAGDPPLFGYRPEACAVLIPFFGQEKTNRPKPN